MRYINRDYKKIQYPNTEQHNSNLAIFDEFKNSILNYLYISDDSEWESPVYSTDEVGSREQEDIISHQYVLKYPGFPAIGYIIYRKENDKPFKFWDWLSVVKQYLNDINYHASYSSDEVDHYSRLLHISKNDTRKQLFSTRIPPILMTTYFGGVDVTAYADWFKYLDGKVSGSKHSNIVALHQHALFSNQFAIQITSPDRHRKVPVIMQYRDTMSLGPQGGLEKLGEMVGQPKIDTTEWDQQDKLSENYYKQHMRELLKRRPDDYKKYAMRDAEITMKYLGFFMRQVAKVYQAGMIDHLCIPATIMSLSDKLIAHCLQQPYSDGQVVELANQIFGKNNLDRYCRPKAYNQLPPAQQLDDWKKLIASLSSTKRKMIIRKQEIFIKKMKSFLSRSTVKYQVDNMGRVDQMLNFQDLLKNINFKELYRLNPNLKPTDLTNKEKRIRQYHPSFNIDKQIRAKFNAQAFRLKRNHSNELPTIDQIVNYLWDNSLFTNRVKKAAGENQLIKLNAYRLLEDKIDFKFTRTGFNFIESSNYGAKHKKNVHDMTTLRPDSTYNQSFNMARRAYIGGQNQCYNPGILKFPFIYDIDEKSSYTMAGHLIPDIRLDCPALIDRVDFKLSQFRKKVLPKLPNGVFTVGVCDVEYELPSTTRRAPVGIKASVSGATPKYVLEGKRANLSLTDVISLIEHGANVYFHRLIVPVQKKLDGSIDQLYAAGKAQDWALTQRNIAKEKCGKDSAEQEFFKLLGNSCYGKVGQGLNAKTTKEFSSGQSYFIPVAKSTNPIIAMQYTAIARYQVNFLMDLMDRMYPNNLVPSVTTDGFIWAGKLPLNKEKIVEEIRNAAPEQWVEVSDNYFKGQFFEFKSKIKDDRRECSHNTILTNLKTRFNFTLDERIRATAGLLNVSIVGIYRDVINNVVETMVKQRRISNLNDMKHRVDYKYLMSEWQQPIYQSLAYDFTNKPVEFHDNEDGHGYYVTAPFRNVEEAEAFKASMKPYSELFPLFDSKYADAFLSLDNHLIMTKNGYRIAWIKEDASLKGTNYLELVNNYQTDYKWKVLLRYLAKNEKKYDLKALYNEVFSKRYSSFSGFKQSIKRAKGKFINQLVVLKENWDEKLSSYEVGC